MARTDKVSLRDLIDNYLRTVIVHEVECDSCGKKNGKKTKSSFSKLTAVARVSQASRFYLQNSVQMFMDCVSPFAVT